MKVQNLTIVFIIIIIPIIIIFSLYLNLQTKTIRLQTDYDHKLIEATKEAMEAYEINTVEWNSKYSSLANVKRQNIMSSINVFTTSLSNKLGVSGTSKENILNYIPAIVYIMYDGYYIYSPTYIPKTITNEKGVQLFYYDQPGGVEITSSATQNIKGAIYSGEPMYEWKSGEKKSGTYNDKTYTFTTNIEDAKKEYKHVLKTFVPYTTTYEDYTINYTLDNYIRVYGKNQAKEGYFFKGYDSNTNIPMNDVLEIEVMNEDANFWLINPETLTENIYVKENDSSEAQLKEYPYIYNSNNDKRYYDRDKKQFFMVNNKNVQVFLPDSQEVESTLAEYKKVLVRTSSTNGDYIELYQLLNGGENKNWYKKNGNNYEVYDEYQPDIAREKDCSAINYYVETYSFNYWLEQNDIDVEEILKNKKQTIINDINKNLNLSISNYNANSRMNYKIFELTDEDWEQALSNISMITFFQGPKIGLKTYNNYVVATSSENNEFVSEDSLYYLGDNLDKYYHRYNCAAIIQAAYTAYRSTDFKPQTKENGNIVYYKHIINYHENIYNQLECFDCIVNRNNMNDEVQDEYRGIKETALARERYVQMAKIDIEIKLNKTLEVVFDANGGSVSQTSKTVTLGNVYGELPIPTKEGSTFKGWYTYSEGGTRVTEATIVGKPENHTLYAQWDTNTYTCTITFDANGGNISSTTKKVTHNSTYGALPVPTKEGYIFDGWYTEAEGGSLVNESTVVEISENHILYAHWKPIHCRIIFDPCGGYFVNGDYSIEIAEYYEVGSSYGTFPEVVHLNSEYVFDGWYTEISGGNKVESTMIVTRRTNFVCTLGTKILYGNI